MAKRKKLNKRVVILLAVLGLLILLAAPLASKRVRNKLFPKDPAAAARRAQAHLEKGEYVQANKAYGEAYAFSMDHPRGAEFCFDWSQMKMQWLEAKGEGMSPTFGRKLFDQAIDLLRQAMYRDPQFVKAQRRLCEILWRRASAKNYLIEADKLLNLDAQDHQAYYRRALVRADLANTATGKEAVRTLEDFDKAIELKKDFADYWISKAGFLARLKLLDKAEQIYKDSLVANPDNPKLCVAYAQYLYIRDNRDEAIKLINRAKNTKNNSLPYRALASIYLREKRFDDARDECLDALKIDPVDFTVRLKLSDIYRTLQKPQKVLDILREGIKLVSQQTTQPTTVPSQLYKIKRKNAIVQLNYALANALLDSLQRDAALKQEDKDKIIAEARSCLEKLLELKLDKNVCNSVEGYIAWSEGNVSKAQKLLELAYEGFGKTLDQKTARLLISIYLSKDLPTRAEKILDRFLDNRTYRQAISFRLLKAELELRYHNYSEASRHVSEALKINPNSTKALKLKGLISALLGDEDVRIATNTKPDAMTVGMLMNRATSLWMDEKRDKAILITRKLYDRDPKNLRVISWLVNRYQQMEQFDKAKEILDKARLDLPQNAADIKYLQQLLAEKDVEKRLQMQLKRTEKLKKPLQRVLAKADLYRQAKKEKLFVQYLKEAERIKPDDRNVIRMMFSYAVSQKDWQQAELSVETASKANLDGVKGKLFAMELALARNQLDKAIKLLIEALSIDPDRKQARTQLGMLYMQQGKLDKAAEAFDSVVKSDRGYAPAVIGMMLVLERQGKADLYIEWLKRAYRLNPHHREVVGRYLVLQEQNASNLQEIIAKREKLLRQNPLDLQNRIRLGTLYERVDKPDKAEEMYRFVHANAANKLFGTQILYRFYARTKRLAQADKLIQDLLKAAKDTGAKVGAYLLYGEFLAPHKPAEAKNAFQKAISLDKKDRRGHLAMAQFLSRVQPPDWFGAARSMKEYISLSEKNPVAEKELIYYLISSRQFDEADKLLKLILAQNQTDSQALRLKAIIVRKRDNDMSKAEDLLSRAVRNNPNDPQALVDRARLYLTMGELNKAKSDLQRAKTISQNPQIIIHLANVYERMEEFDNSEAVLRDLLHRNKNNTYVIGRLIQLYLRTKKWTALSNLLSDTRKIFPDNPTYWLAEADMWRLRRDSGKEISAFAQAVKIAPDSPRTIQLYLLSLLRAEKYEKTVEVCQNYMGRANFGVWLEAIRAHALFKLKKTDQADRIFREAINKAKPTELAMVVEQIKKSCGHKQTIKKLLAWHEGTEGWQLYNILGELYQQADNLEKAENVYIKARELAPTVPIKARLNYQLGIIYYRMGKLAKSEQAYLDTLKVLPNSVGSLNNLAYMYVEKLNQPEKALPYAKRAFRLKPDDSNILDTYGWVLAKLKKYDEAEKILYRSLDQANPVAASRLHLGWLYEQQGRYHQALKKYRFGREMISDPSKDPLYKEFTNAMKRVQKKLKQGSN